jgi:hypothetical protein
VPVYEKSPATRIVTGVFLAFLEKAKYRFTDVKLLNLRIPSGGSGMVKEELLNVVPGGHVLELLESNGWRFGKLAQPQMSRPCTCTTAGTTRTKAATTIRRRSHRRLDAAGVRDSCVASM